MITPTAGMVDFFCAVLCHSIDQESSMQRGELM